jgi:hypothetical protein
MAKIRLRSFSLLLAGLALSPTLTIDAQNVGVGTAVPAAKLEVDGGLAVTPVTVTAGAVITVPTNETVLRILNDGANVAITVNAPASAAEGQFLSIRNEDATNTATFAGTAIPAGQMADFIFLNGGWRFRAGTATTAWGLTGNAGTVAGTNFIGTTDNVRFDIRTNNAIRATVDANGNVGIGTVAPNAALQLGNVIANRRIVLWEDANNDHQFYGLGINGSTLRFQISDVARQFTFHAATGAASSNELMRIRGDGNVGIGTPTPTSMLTLVGGDIRTTDREIYFRGGVDVNHGLGWYGAGKLWNGFNVNGPVLYGNSGGQLGTFTGVQNTALAWDLNNNVGINVGTPAARLHVNGAYVNNHTAVAAAAAPVVPNNVSHVRLTLAAGGGVSAITGPAAPVEGQKLTIVNEDDGNATFAGATILANGGVASFIRANGVWRLESNASSFAWGLTGNAGTVAGTNFIGTTDNVRFDIRTNNAIRATVDANGNVGIGTTTPNGRLQISNALNNRQIVIWENANNDHEFFGFGINNSILRHQIPVANAAHGHVFYAATGPASSNELMRIRGDGNVGIGSAAPAARLHVVGNSRVDYNAQPLGVNDPAFEIFSPNLGDPTLVSRIRFHQSNQYFASVGYHTLGIQNGPGEFVFWSHNTGVETRLRAGEGHFTSNVGIGTTPGGARMIVNGAWASTPGTVNAGAAPALPTNTSHVRILAVAGGGVSALTAPAAPVEGQKLTIVNEDDGNATFAGATILANGGVASFIYANGVWRLESNASSFAWGLTGNAGTVAGTNFIGTTDNVRFDIRTNNAIRTSVDGNGNVGVGTTTPGFRFDLQAATGTTPQMNIYNPVNAAGNVAGIQLGTASGWSVQLRSRQGNSWLELTDGPGATVVQRWFGSNYHPGNSNAYITNSGANDIQIPIGNVGIGAATPGYRLDVAPLATGEGIRIQDAGTPAGSRFLMIGDDAFFTDFDAADFTGLYGAFNNDRAGLRLGSDGSYLFGDNGFIGVNTTVPTARLHVAGEARIGSTGATAATVGAGGLRWDGTNIQFSNGAAWNNLGGWSLTGNAGTTAGTNFIGTTDNVRFDVRTNNAIRLTVDAAGNVGIGTVTPARALFVNGDIGIVNAVNVVLRGTTPITWSDGFQGTGFYAGNGEVEEGGFYADGNYAAVISPGDNDLVKFIDEDGWDNAGTIFDGGALRARIDGVGQYFQVSDSAQKFNIRRIDNSLSRVMQLNGYTYAFRLLPGEVEKNQAPIEAAGVLAQELEQVLPEAVSNTDGHYMVNYSAIIPLMIEAMKEQQREIEQLRQLLQNQQNAAPSPR